MFSGEGVLLFSAVGLVPIGLSYGSSPRTVFTGLFGDKTVTATVSHILHAIMGLYLAMSSFWLYGFFVEAAREAALFSLMVFMLGLAAGRVLHYAREGTANIHWLFPVFTFLEVVLGGSALYFLV